MPLTDLQRRQLLDDGYVVIPGAVPAEMVAAARRAINYSLGEGMDPAQLGYFRGRTYCPELRDQPIITDLYNTTIVREIAEAAVGRDKLATPAAAQIALRFPREPGADQTGKLRGHMDGAEYTARNESDKVPDEGKLFSFTALAGIYLSDLPDEWSGNFVVWPRSHRFLEAYFREHGMADVTKVGGLGNIFDELDLPDPVQVTCHAGDAVLTHYQVIHSSVPNLSPDIRYALYFRLKHVNHEQHKDIVTTNIWHEWDGIRPLLAEESPAI